jgi:ribonuclease HII
MISSPSLREERRLRKEGYEWVGGVDEVGRGAWAGPLTVGVAVLRPRVQLRSMPAWLRDSKQLTEARREDIFEAVGAWCHTWAVGHASAAECDEWGMTEAWRVAAHRALSRLDLVPAALIVDGPTNLLRHEREPFEGLVRPIVDADAHCASVAAASVLAKVVRDRIMREESEHFPAYAFERNKGYPSLVHKTALRGYGPSAIHRQSWAFMRGLPWSGHPWSSDRVPSDDGAELGVPPDVGAELGVPLDDGGDFGEVAGDGVALPAVDQRRFLGGADVLRFPTPGPEAAAGGG